MTFSIFTNGWVNRGLGLELRVGDVRAKAKSFLKNQLARDYKAGHVPRVSVLPPHLGDAYAGCRMSAVSSPMITSPSTTRYTTNGMNEWVEMYFIRYAITT
jgi:hypothetical protein